MSKFPTVINLLVEKMEEEKKYVEVGKKDKMPKMRRYYQKRVDEYRLAIKVLGGVA